MPVILRRDAEAAWIDPATPQPHLFELLESLPAAETEVRAVGPAVNDARYDGPECLADEVPEGQASLF
jgi:putative SOS response-associated peptidase YedK